MKTHILSLVLGILLSHVLLAQKQYNESTLVDRLNSHIESEKKQELREELWESKAFPKELLVGLLSHRNPAIRSEALELLEELTGNDFGFAPLRGKNDDRNSVAIERWEEWSKGAGTIKKKKRELSDEDARRYISEIMSADRDGFYRAVRRLEPFHLHAVGKIEGFIQSTPQLKEGAIAKLKQAQYQLVLARTNAGSEATLARELTFGSRDQKLAALNSLKGTGLVAIPILKDFLTDKDALIRETSMDAFLEVGGEQVLDIVAPILKKEKDSNVLHIALRKLKGIQGGKCKALVATFISHEDEDIVISSLKVYKDLTSNRRNRHINFSPSTDSKEEVGKPTDVQKLVIKLLDDKRWRILSAALEYVGETKLRSAEDKVIKLLTHDDDFVKANAIKASIAITSSKAIPVMVNILKNSESNTRVVIEGLASMQGMLTPDQIKVINDKGSDAIISLIAAYSSSKPLQTKVVASYVKHADIDVACAALRSLADDTARVKQGYVANLLSDVLKSDEDEKIEAILSNLSLPKNPMVRNALGARLLEVGNVGENKELNELYDAFAQLSKALADKQEQIVATDSAGGVGGLVKVLRGLLKGLKKEERRMRIVVLLARYGDAEVLKQLSTEVAGLEPSERLAIARALTATQSEFGLIALEALIADASSEIRNAAAYAFFEDEDNRVLVAKGLEYSIKEGAKVIASEMYDYSLAYASKDDKSRRAVGKWCRKVLKDRVAPLDKQILALTLLRASFTSSDRKMLMQYLESSEPLLRRAAWYTFASSRFFSLEEGESSLFKDKSVLVRMAFPMALNKKSRGAWLHYFAEDDTIADKYYDYSSRKRTLPSGAEPMLRKLIETDASDRVRFEAMFTLFCYSKTIDLEEFIKLMGKQPKSSKAESRVIDYVEDNYKRMGRGLAPLIGYLDLRKMGGRYRNAVIMHFFGEKSTMAFSSFSDLANTVEAIGEAPQHVEPEKIEDNGKKRSKIELIYFYEKGCKECQRVESKVFPKFRKEFSEYSNLELEIKKVDIYKPESGVMNRALVGRLGVPKAKGKKPAVFSQAGVLLERDITNQSMMEMALQVIDMPMDETWNEVTEEEKVIAEKQLDQEFADLTLPVIIIAGLFDGINPCAFATIIFFLSYLQVARRSPKEIFFVGCAFIFGVFIAYFSIGLVFHSLLEVLTSKFAGVKTMLNYIFAIIALVVAYFSFMDYLKARKGDLKGMTLQLPGALKNRVRSVIRKGSKSSFFVLAAFVTGIVISFIELACTGQVYIPIIYQVQKGNHDAVYYLLAFNIAFVLPLVIIFGLAMMGMKSQALINFQQKHTGKIKLMFAILFVLLALMLLFNDEVSGWFIEVKKYFGLDKLGA